MVANPSGGLSGPFGCCRVCRAVGLQGRNCCPLSESGPLRGVGCEAIGPLRGGDWGRYAAVARPCQALHARATAVHALRAC